MIRSLFFLILVIPSTVIGGQITTFNLVGSSGLILCANYNEGQGTLTKGNLAEDRGTITGATWVRGIWSNALKFLPETTNEVSYGVPVFLPANMTEMSIEVGFRYFSFEDAAGGGCNTHGGCADDCNPLVAEDDGQKLEFGIDCKGYLYYDGGSGGGTGWQTVMVSTVQVPINRWSLVHITARIDASLGAVLDFYLDGKKSTATYNDTGQTSFGGATHTVFSVGTVDPANTFMTIDGEIDHVYMWKRKITSAEVSQRYSEWVGGNGIAFTGGN